MQDKTIKPDFIQPGSIPQLSFGPVEKHGRIVLRQTLDTGSTLYLKYGCLLLKEVFPAEIVNQLQQTLLSKYKDYLNAQDHSDTLKVGDKRTMLTLTIEDIFSHTDIYANPYIYPIIGHLLNHKFVLNSFGSVISLAGAEDQHIHRDHPNIFEESQIQAEGKNLLSYMPPFAITVLIPLTPLNQKTGTTRMWPGSHLKANEDAGKKPAAYPETEIGDCILMDYRILHNGMANKSDKVRSLVYAVYSSPWFRDASNFNNQDPLVISESAYNEVPEQFLHLFRWAKRIPNT